MRFKMLTTLFIFLLSITLTMSAAALTATSPSINVLDLPSPQISKIDAEKNVVHMMIDVDPDASADFRAGVIVEDGGGNVLEVSPMIAVDSPEDIKVPLRTAIKAGYKITPEITNNDIKNTGEGGVHSGAGSKSGGGSTTSSRTEYIVTEATPEEIVVEKIVEVEKPVYIASSQDKGNPGTEDGQESLFDGENPSGLANEAVPPVDPQVPPQDENSGQCALIWIFLVILAIIAGAYINHWLESRKRRKYDGVSHDKSQ